MSIGVVVGRFQCPELHKGHIDLLKAVQAGHDKLVVLLGCSQISKVNPLPYELRAKVIGTMFPDAQICPLMDRMTDAAWSKSLDALLEAMYPGAEITLYSGRDGFVESYTGRCKTDVLNFGAGDLGISASAIRDMIVRRPKFSTDFNMGIIHALGKLYPQTFVTVDIAMVRSGGVLLAQKDCDGGLYRFPGGFVDITDVSLEHAAKRELQEETGMTTESGLQYICSIEIDDWRYRNIPDQRVMTTFFKVDYFAGRPVAGDDVDSVAWRPIGESKMVSGHDALMSELKHGYTC